jgi:hypothetical protein
MANEENEENWDLKLRQDTEQEFFTELALHEAERWKLPFVHSSSHRP